MEYQYERELIDGVYNLPNPYRDIDPATGNPILPCKDIYDAIGIIVMIEGCSSDFCVTTPVELDAGQKAAMDTAIANHKNNL